MEFGIFVPSNPKRAAEDAQFAEEHGFTHAWFGDVPMSGGDLYVCMALAAAATRTIKLGAGIAIASNRIAPVTAHSIATINAIAPGRTILGFGSGSFTLGLMGLPPMKVSALRRQLQAIRGLLHAGEVVYETAGIQRKIRFFNRDYEFIKLDPHIPLYVAASMPKVAALAGEFGDGVFSGGPAVPEAVTSLLQQVTAGARQAGRELDKVPCAWEAAVCILHPNETFESPRVLQSTGGEVMMLLKAYASHQFPAEFLPAMARPAYQKYLAHIEQMSTPSAERHLQLWEGVFTLRPEERHFVTPEVASAIAMVGKREELIERIKVLEEVGLTQIVVAPRLDRDGFRDVVSNISHELIGRV